MIYGSVYPYSFNYVVLIKYFALVLFLNHPVGFCKLVKQKKAKMC